MTAREIQAHLQEMYGAEGSPTLISSVTDAVMDEVKAWQSRPLDTLYPQNLRRRWHRLSSSDHANSLPLELQGVFAPRLSIVSLAHLDPSN